MIDANKVARDSGMGGRINTVMQACFFAISGVLPPEEAIDAIKNSIRKTYAKKGEEIVQMNLRAVDETLAHLLRSGNSGARSRRETSGHNGHLHARTGIRAQGARRNHRRPRRSPAGERVA